MPTALHDDVCDLEIGPATKHLHRPQCLLNTRNREDRIAQAIGDPGSVLPRAGRDTDQPESVTRWSTRAVIAVVDADRSSSMPPGMAYLDDAPGGGLTTGGDLRCQTRAVNADGRTFRCTINAWHPNRLHEFEAERTCRVCGCTDLNACTGGCAWVDADLCSACLADAMVVRR
jgi:hypothetical protein